MTVSEQYQERGPRYDLRARSRGRRCWPRHGAAGGGGCLRPAMGASRLSDNDPRTAEVVSKVILLARDKEIKDPSILEQIL